MFIIDELAMYNCPKGMNKVVLYCIVLYSNNAILSLCDVFEFCFLNMSLTSKKYFQLLTFIIMFLLLWN